MSIEIKKIDKKGKVTKIRYLNLGVSFDHSFLDANKTNDLLKSLTEEMKNIVNIL
jgi:hypothetical protein